MSVDISLESSALSQSQWFSQCQRWLKENSSELFSQTCMLSNRELFISGEGSTRGFFISFDESRIQLSLPSMASISDWRRGYLMLSALKLELNGSLSSSDGYADELTVDTAESDYYKQIQFDTSMLRNISEKDGGLVRLPTPFFEIRIDEDEVKLETNELMGIILSQFSLFAKSYHARIETYGDGFQENELTFSYWGLINSLLPKTDFIAFLKTKGLNEYHKLPFDTFKDILGAQMIDAGKDKYFVPNLNQYGEDIVSDLFNEAEKYEQQAVAKNEQTNHEKLQYAIVSAPLLCCMAVAASDGKVEGKEVDEIIKSITDYAEKAHADSVKTLLQQTLLNAASISNSLNVSRQLIPSVLNLVPEAIENQLNDHDREEYIDSLVSMMNRTARASSGLFGFGAVSKKEKVVIAKIEASLRDPGIDKSVINFI